MNMLMLFTDGSVNTKSKVGYGAYLVLTEDELSADSLNPELKVQRFKQTSSTKLELETLLWALKDIHPKNSKITVYTDSQNIIELMRRRDRLEKNNYRSKNNKLLNNHEIYKEFFKLCDQFDCDFIKVRGHKVSNQKDGIDRFFTLVDRASRRALRGNK